MQINPGVEDNQPVVKPVSSDLDGTKPVTNRESKMVMLRGERGDNIRIDEVVQRFRDNKRIPSKFKIIRRVGTYYGTELELEPTDREQGSSYLITAPGPDAFLYLWDALTDDDGFRTGWKKVAELKASFSDDLPKYPICTTCGEPIKSLEHERLAAIDQCDSLLD